MRADVANGSELCEAGSFSYYQLRIPQEFLLYTALVGRESDRAQEIKNNKELVNVFT